MEAGPRLGDQGAQIIIGDSAYIGYVSHGAVRCPLRRHQLSQSGNTPIKLLERVPETVSDSCPPPGVRQGQCENQDPQQHEGAHGLKVRPALNQGQEEEIAVNKGDRCRDAFVSRS